jgi:hypothetical protein
MVLKLQRTAMTPNANINDRGSVELVYPLSACESDAGANSAADATMRRGVRIESVPDPLGAFRVVRATASLQELPRGTHTFLCPYMGKRYGEFVLVGGSRGSVEERRDIFESDADEYHAFIERVIEAARNNQAERHLDPHRLAGFG